MDAPQPKPAPPPKLDAESADAHGVVAWSWPDALTAENLISAYRSGVFPWPGEPDAPVPWTSPDPRAILEFDRLHLPRSLRQARRRSGWTFTIDRAFGRVISECSRAPRPGQSGTWILPEIIAGYTELHRLGHAHSVEVWEGEELVGGLYGVDSGGVFCGESMFHTRSNASKLALLHLVEHLGGRGATWIDIQQLTPHMEALGAREITRRAYLRKLRDGLRAARPLFARVP
jgi:leucyl/phenylalanyl-tRNA--protein transferase